ncbi:MAG: hypothetical protein ACE10K_08785, partial [Rhodothermales bacterium]
IRQQTPLADWRARDESGLGIMLVEMWAYVCDSLSFYDEVIAHEVYLRTARRRPSLRKLVELLGYLPRPAVAASVLLAAFAEGRQPLTLPPGTAFRSGAFDGEPPQVFELGTETLIHPFTNQWTLVSRPTTLEADDPAFLLINQQAQLEAGAPVLISVGSIDAQNHVGRVDRVGTHTGADGTAYTRVDFSNPTTLAAGTALDDIGLKTPTQRASLWNVSASPPSVEEFISIDVRTYLTLDSLYRQIKPGDYVVVSQGDDDHRWFKLDGVDQVMRQAIPSGTITINNNTFVTPASEAPVTRLLLDQEINYFERMSLGAADWTNDDRADLIVHYGMVGAGTVVAEPKTTLAASDPLTAAGPVEVPADGWDPSRFLFEDKNQQGLEIGGSLDFGAGMMTLDQGTSWTPSLAFPVEVYGNVVSATRGETVNDEVLGSGDASQANESFVLKKKPLTYTASPTAGNESGVASSLTIYVDGVLWTEAPSFFGVEPEAQVYIVRQDDEDESSVTFGDGKRGARLPTGVDNVVAYYRFGAGAASPPAGSITQLAKPVKGLQRVRNPVAAFGGDGAEAAEGLRTYAPASALLLGRAVSMLDMEAAAAGVAGVRAVRTEWRWHAGKQRPVVQVWYIGEAGVETTVSQTLRGLTDPATPIDVEQAQGLPLTLSLDLEIDERYLEDEVIDAVRARLMDEERGLLAPERIGIGRPLYRSRVFEEVLAEPGTVTVRSLTRDGAPFPGFAISPGAGQYFDLENGALVLNGKEASDA